MPEIGEKAFKSTLIGPGKLSGISSNRTLVRFPPCLLAYTAGQSIVGSQGYERVTCGSHSYSQPTSPTHDGISENVMNIRILLCNVRHLNGILNISQSENLSEKDAFN